MDNIVEHNFSTYGKAFYMSCPKCNKSSWMQSKTIIDCGRCGYNVGENIMDTIELRQIDRFNLITISPWNDGSVALAIKDNDILAPHFLDARPTDEGFDVRIFNRESGAMDHFFTLRIAHKRDKEGLPLPSIVSKIFENCVFYLKKDKSETPDGFVNIKIEMGDRVLCDNCNEEYTNSKESGGFLFDSNAICPKCAPAYYESAKGFDELSHIKAICPDEMSFAQFVLSFRK